MTCENCKCVRCVDSRIKTLGDLPLEAIVIDGDKLFRVDERNFDGTVTLRRLVNQMNFDYSSALFVKRCGDWYKIQTPVEMP